ncbi:MAG TPA: carbohydrate kinase family protein, partial [Bryobacteraceae bacterium]|nr:carbohydrate kinase family protein [Bryobacteraceae bacterium]
MKQGVLCSGSIVFDTLVRPVEDPQWGTTTFVDAIESHVGGNGANTSLALSTLGASVRLLGAVGRDEQGQFLLESLQRAGVDIHAVTLGVEATAASIVMVNGAGDRKFLHRVGASATAFTAPVQFTPELTAGMAYYHLASLFILPNLRKHAPETLGRSRAAGLITSLDTNWDPEGRWMQDLAPCLPHLDIAFFNEDEARMTTGTADPRKAAKFLLERGVRTAVLKLGARGCAIYTGADEILCPAFDVEAKDTTGAGDCFVAGFLAA